MALAKIYIENMINPTCDLFNPFLHVLHPVTSVDFFSSIN